MDMCVFGFFPLAVDEAHGAAHKFVNILHDADFVYLFRLSSFQFD